MEEDIYGGKRHLQDQITKLANFIMENVPSEPSRNEGAVDCAIRIITELQAKIKTLEPLQPSSIKDSPRVNKDSIFNKEGFEQAVRVLARIQTVVPEAILAGGALRDIDFGMPPKDLDIWINVNSQDAFDKKLRLIADLFGLSFEYEGEGNYDGISEKIFVSQYHLSLENGTDINVIGVNLGEDFTVQRLVMEFDFGICRIGYHSGNQVYVTGEYLDDKENETFSLDLNDVCVNEERSMERWDRLRFKYPGFTLKITGHDGQVCVKEGIQKGLFKGKQDAT